MGHQTEKFQAAALLLLFACGAPPDAAPDPRSTGAAVLPPDAPPPRDPWDGIRWTNGRIPYVIDRDGSWPLTTGCQPGLTMTAAQAQGIEDAISELEALTPLRFEEHTVADPPNTHRSYVLYRGATGSESDIRGMPRDGSVNCVYIGDAGGDDVEQRRLVLHETVHNTGFAHEQQRPDRDLFINFDAHCITNDTTSLGKATGKLFGIDDDGLLITPYDYNSVMQYGSINSCDTTVAGCDDGSGNCARPPQLKKGAACSSPPVGTDDCWIHTPSQLSVHDVNALWRMYERPLGVNNDNDEFGSAFAVGDFDGDGYLDLAVGAPGNDAVFIWKGTGGSTPSGLGRLVAWKVLRPSDAVGLLPFSKARFGASLAAGDFDGDGVIDLAVGAPGEGNGAQRDGSVFIYTSGLASEFSPRRSLFFSKVVSQVYLGLGLGKHGEHFGTSLAVGDFDGDGKTDLAIGVPDKKVGGKTSGEVVVMPGASPNAGVVLDPESVTGGTRHNGARFGAALAAGQLNGGGPTDLVVGSPESDTAPARSGSVYVFGGFSTGLAGRQILQPSDATGGQHFRFGAALALGNFDNSGPLQLAVGAPWRPHGHGKNEVKRAGAIYMLKNTSTAISFTERDPIVQQPHPQEGNRLGGVLLRWRAICSPVIDCIATEALVAGLPHAGFDTGGIELYSFSSLDPSAVWTRDVLPLPASVAAGNQLGAALIQANLVANSTGFAGSLDLVAGQPGWTHGAGSLFIRDFDEGAPPNDWLFFSQTTSHPE